MKGSNCELLIIVCVIKLIVKVSLCKKGEKITYYMFDFEYINIIISLNFILKFMIKIIFQEL